MSSRYLDIKPSDRADLEEIVKDVSFDMLKREIFDAVSIALGDEMDEDCEKRIAKEIIEIIDIEFPLQEFVDTIGLFGWEIFTKSDCIKIEKALVFYNAFKKSKLYEFLKQKLKRGPIVKKLRNKHDDT